MKPDLKPRFQRTEAQIAALTGMDDAIQAQRIMTVFLHEQGGIIEKVIACDDIQAAFIATEPAGDFIGNYRCFPLLSEKERATKTDRDTEKT